MGVGEICRDVNRWPVAREGSLGALPVENGRATRVIEVVGEKVVDLTDLDDKGIVLVGWFKVFQQHEICPVGPSSGIQTLQIADTRWGIVGESKRLGGLLR